MFPKSFLFNMIFCSYICTMTDREIIDNIIDSHCAENINGRKMYSILEVLRMLSDALKQKDNDQQNI